MTNPNVTMTLEEAVEEVLTVLTGQDLRYDPDMDRYRVVTKFLNRALRANALEAEWSYYSDLEDVGVVHAGDEQIAIRSTVRVRGIGDDAVRLVDPNGRTVVWAYLLPRDSLHKYNGRPGLWASHTRGIITFSKRLGSQYEGLTVRVPVMREPRMFNLPPKPKPGEAPVEVPEEVLEQELDFDYPDIVIARAAFLYAFTDPVMQPRAPMLEDLYKNYQYQLVERDTNVTDMPYMNEFFVPVQSGLNDHSFGWNGPHPHSDERR